MKVKFVLSAMLLVALLMGGGLYYSMAYAYYDEVTAEEFGDVQLTSILSGQPEAIATANFSGIDSISSPIRFRACFETTLSFGTLTDRYAIYENAEPLNAPGWFSCFNAKDLGPKIASGEAVAFLGQANVAYGIDRIVAFTPDGHGYIWHQINACGDAKFNGDPLPEGCPEPVEGTN